MKKGKLIVIDGMDGSGKKTQADLLIKRLKKEKKKAVLVDFPNYGDFFGKISRRYLDGEFGDINPYPASLIFAADRWKSKEKIEDYLKKGFFVISNRYVNSNLAYQSARIKNVPARPAFIKWDRKMEYEIFGIPKPDLVFYLDIPISITDQLISKRKQKNEFYRQNLEFLKQVHENYRKLSKEKDWVVIECLDSQKLLSKAEIAEKIWLVVVKRIVQV